jgi:hypothetical protein
MFLSKFSTTFMFRVFHERVYNLFKNDIFGLLVLKTKFKKREEALTWAAHATSRPSREAGPAPPRAPAAPARERARARPAPRRTRSRPFLARHAAGVHRRPWAASDRAAPLSPWSEGRSGARLAFLNRQPRSALARITTVALALARTPPRRRR